VRHFLKNKKQNKHKKINGHRWLTPVILPTQEAEIRRVEVRGQPGQIIHETVFEKTHHKKGLVEWFKW
jgi:hypothetical protein